jgi:hypothetical protein
MPSPTPLLLLLLLLLCPGTRAQSPCSGVRFVRLNNTRGSQLMNIVRRKDSPTRARGCARAGATSAPFPTLRLQVEVQAWSNGVNVAQGKSASSSSQLSASYPASRAVDGNIVQNLVSESFFHTAGTSRNEFWQVDLGNAFTIDRAIIYNRWNSSCCRERVIGTSLFLMDAGRAVVGPVVNLTGGRIMNVSFAGACAPSPSSSPAPTPGYCAPRYIRVQSVRNNGAETGERPRRGGLRLLLAAIFLPPPRPAPADTLNFNEIVAIDAYGANAALRKAASSLNCYSNNCAVYGPAFVTDGSTGDSPGFFNSASGPSANPVRTDFLEIDLGASVLLTSVIFYNRLSHCHRNSLPGPCHSRNSGGARRGVLGL